MGTIPAPNISQDAIQIAQMPQNALQEYARTAALQQQTAASAQEMQQRQQLAPGALQQQQQVTQSQQMQNQQAQLDLEDAQNAHKLGPQFLQKDDSGKITGFDNEGYYNALIGTGMNPAKVNQLRMQNVTYQQNLQKLGKDQLDLQNEKNDNAYQIVDPLRTAANDPKADIGHVNDVWQHVAPQLLKLGLNPAELPASFASPQEAVQKLQDFEIELGQHKQMLADAKTGAETAQNAAKAVSETKQAIPELGIVLDKATGQTTPLQGANGMMTPAMMESKYVALAQKKDQGQALSPDDASWMKGYEKYKTLVPTANINLQRGLLTPEAQAMAAQAYTQTGQLPAGMRSPAMSSQVLNTAAGPAGTPTPDIAANKMQYGTEQALQKGFTVGTQGQQLTAINTARNHMATFKEMADALDNGHMLLLNQLGNSLGMQFGSDKATNFNIAKSAFAGEVGKAFAGANVGVQDRQELMDKISAASSPAQLKGYADTADQLLEGKQKSLKQTYSEGMKGQPNFGGNQGGGGKTLSMASIQKAAQDHGVSVDEAKRQAQAAGYTIQ